MVPQVCVCLIHAYVHNGKICIEMLHNKIVFIKKIVMILYSKIRLNSFLECISQNKYVYVHSQVCVFVHILCFLCCVCVCIRHGQSSYS